ncbi:porin family protein [Spirosoma spitsbergense]|jgi:hypothetical protein|uniref:porin family protein n=1 Tax=Spirosoma spitsbergense TaxID=431554 RepID=UPI0003648AF7|nr:porin family protein [Spirosoma spitsbergense]
MKNAACLLIVLLLGLFPHVSSGQLGPDIPSRPPTDLDRKIDKFLQASIDLVRQKLSGPSYQGDAPKPGDVLVLNLALKYHNQALVDQIINYYQSGSHNSLNPADPATLLAVNTTQPGPTTPPEKERFVRHLSLLYGIQLIGKGGKYSDRFGTSTARMTYLEIPAYVLYNHKLPEGKGRLFGGVGFYLGYGLWGTLKYDEPGGQESFSAFDKLNGYKRFDAGLGFTGGYQLPQGLSLSLEYELGLVNIDPARGDDKTRNRALSLNVAYPLKKLVDNFRKK